MATKERGERRDVKLVRKVWICICILSVSIKAIYPSCSLKFEFALFTQVRAVLETTKVEVTTLVLRSTPLPY